MLVLVYANNCFQLFVGWEGVGVASMLIDWILASSWWYSQWQFQSFFIESCWGLRSDHEGDVGHDLCK